MTAAGWILLGLSLSFVIGLAGFCYARVLAPLPRDQEPPADDG